MKGRGVRGGRQGNMGKIMILLSSSTQHVIAFRMVLILISIRNNINGTASRDTCKLTTLLDFQCT